MSDNEMVRYQTYADMDARRLKAEAKVAALEAELAEARGRSTDGLREGWLKDVAQALAFAEDLAGCVQCFGPTGDPEDPEAEDYAYTRKELDKDAAAVSIRVKAARAALATPQAASGWRPEVRRMADMMETQLKRNEGRGHWQDCGAGYLTDRIHKQAGDLATYATWPDKSAFARTCADIANFAMMLADNAGALAKPDTKEGARP